MATTYDKASLVMIPSGYKDDKLYSLKPTDGSGDFTFSRDGAGASPATRVNASGLIEKGRTNEILQSNSFDTTWAAILGASVTGGQAGYDGSNDAWEFTKASGQSSRIYQDITLSPIVHTTSIYAKAGTLRYLAILEFSGSFVYFDLQNGTSNTASGSPIDVNIEAVGGGWYRCSITDDSNITQLRIYASDTDGSISGAGTIFLQDAQVENGLVATDYIETTTTAVSAGLLGDMPRLDYSGGASCPSLLLEPSRTNLVPHSEYFDGWTLKDAISIESNTNETISPEGLYNASKMIEAATTGTHRVFEAISGTNKTLTFFAKAGERDWVNVLVDNGGYVFFNVATGEKGTQQSGSPTTIEDYGNGWYRCSVYNFHNTYALIGVSASDNAQTYTGDGTSGVYLYGAQVEAASYSTSYIPTYGTATGRAADICKKESASTIIGQSEGTAFGEFKGIDLDSYTNLTPVLSDGTANNFIKVYYNPASNGITAFARNGGSIQVNITLAASINDGNNKIAFAYANNDFIVYLNGSELMTDTSISVPACSKVSIGSNETDAESQVLENKQALLFKTRLTNAELAALTA